MSRITASLTTLVAMATVAVAQASKPTQDELLAQKLRSPFLAKAPWFTDWRSACATAAEREQLVFGYFTTVNH